MSYGKRRRDRNIFLEADNVFIDADRVVIRADEIVIRENNRARFDAENEEFSDQSNGRQQDFEWQ